jgi:hypothetical protein
VADNGWSWSTCNPEVQWYGIPGSGSYYWTARFGTYWVGGGIYQRYAAPDIRWECGPLGPPVKEYQWLSEFGAWGQWFEYGAIYYQNGAWRVAFGNWGQTAGRLAGEPEVTVPDDAEAPPDAPSSPPPVASPVRKRER